MTSAVNFFNHVARVELQSDSHSDRNPRDAEWLRGNILSFSNKRLATGKIDPHRFRVDFPDLWAAYLRYRFESPKHVAVYFRVTAGTADNWLMGVNRPSGERVVVAAIEDKDRFLKFVGRAA